MDRISFQLTNRRNNLSAYRQFFGTEPRVPLQWKDRIKHALDRALAQSRSARA